MSKPHVLIVVTSHERLGETGKKTGLWLEELASPYYTFVDRGAEITIASIKGGEPPIDPKSVLDFQTETTKRFKADHKAEQLLKKTVRLTDVDAGDYDAIFLPGGHGPMWDFAANEVLTNLIAAFDEEEKVIAAVCHGPAALVNVETAMGIPLVQRRRVTAFTNKEEQAMELDNVVPFLLETRLRNLGANFESGKELQPFVCRDGNLITGQNPASSGPAAEEVLKVLSVKAD